MKRIVYIFLLFPFLVFSQTTAKVVGITDGDTITVLLDDKTQVKLRLAEIDCPESGQAFGKNAKLFTSDVVFGKMICFEQTDVDQYNRIVAKIYYDENTKYLSEEIIKAGMGWWYYRYSDDEHLGELQDEAEKQKLGLWYDDEPTPPWEYRKNKKKGD